MPGLDTNRIRTLVLGLMGEGEDFKSSKKRLQLENYKQIHSFSFFWDKNFRIINIRILCLMRFNMDFNFVMHDPLQLSPD